MVFSRKINSKISPRYNHKLLGLSIKLSHKDLRKFSKDITNNLKIRKKTEIPLYRKCIEVVLTNLLRCSKDEKLLYSRSKNKGFTKIRRYNPLGITVERLVKVIDILEEYGLLMNFIGNPAKNKENRVPSFIQPTDLFLDTFSDLDTLSESVEELYMDKEECLILRDEHKQLVEYRDNYYTRTARAVVVGLNSINRSFMFHDKDKQEITNHYCRIYNESFDKGGRFYRANILNIKNKGTNDRLKITCNYEPMVEVDYCNLHIMLLTVLQGFQYNPEIDLYNKCIPEKWINKNTRSVVKLATNIMLNAKTKRSATSAIQELLEDYLKTSSDDFPSDCKSKTVMDWIYKGHAKLSEFFCSVDSTGLELMKLDSDMAHHVIHCFVSEEKPILPIHDSFLVRRSDKMFLVEAMADAMKVVTGREDIQVPLEAEWWDEKYGYQSEKYLR